MPAIRLSTRRRRSSHALFTPAKPGIYGVQPRPVTFAPNVTPITYVEPDDDDSFTLPSPSSSSPGLSQNNPTTIFPPSSTPAPPPARKRCPPGKRRSQGYIPRPPNAFMLFRADFVRQKHVPGSIETNHGSLSKIIGNCWRQLPLDEKRIWEIKAKQEKANHKAQFPDYRFRPVHNKNKNKSTSTNTTTTIPNTASSTPHPSSNNSSSSNAGGSEEEERRCEQVAQLLLGGMKGEDLARAVRDLDRVREETSGSTTASTTTITSSDTAHSFNPDSLAMPVPVSALNFGYGFGMNSTHTLPAKAYSRRSSSVPLPLPGGSDFFFSPFGNGDSYSTSPPQSGDMVGIALPSVPYFSQSQTQTRPCSPINNISRQHQQRTLFGHRRASSAQPVFRRSWTPPFHPTISTNTYVNGFANNDFSAFDWSSMMNTTAANTHIETERDESPLPDVELELLNGFSFHEGVGGSSNLNNHHHLSSASSTSASSSSVSDHNSPWLGAPSNSHTHRHTRSLSRHRSSLSIAPHDLPPLDISPSSSDMTSWSSSATVPTTSALLSASTASSSSTFPSPASLSSAIPTAKQDQEVTPTHAMFGLNLGMDYHHHHGLGMDMNGMNNSGGVVDYTYGYSDMSMPMFSGGGGAGTMGDMGMGGGGYDMCGVDGMGMAVSDLDTMWNVGQAQHA